MNSLLLLTLALSTATSATPQLQTYTELARSHLMDCIRPCFQDTKFLDPIHQECGKNSTNSTAAADWMCLCTTTKNGFQPPKDSSDFVTACTFQAEDCEGDGQRNAFDFLEIVDRVCSKAKKVKEEMKKASEEKQKVKDGVKAEVESGTGKVAGGIVLAGAAVGVAMWVV